MWILKKIDPQADPVPTVQPNGVNSAPVATTRRPSPMRSELPAARCGRWRPGALNPRVVRRRTLLNVAQPGEPTRSFISFAVSGLPGLATGAMLALLMMLLRPPSGADEGQRGRRRPATARPVRRAASTAGSPALPATPTLLTSSSARSTANPGGRSRSCPPPAVAEEDHAGQRRLPGLLAEAGRGRRAPH